MNNNDQNFPEDLQLKLRRIRKKIDTSSGCGYLYHHFDELICNLEKWHLANPEALDHEELVVTVEKFMGECIYCTCGSPGWLLYSARAFYCANIMLKYIHGDEVKKNLQKRLNFRFQILLNTKVISVLDDTLINKYFEELKDTPYLREVYQCAIKGSIETSKTYCSVDSVWEFVAYKGSLRAKELIKSYLSETGDYTMLKKWIPQLNTPRLAYIWHEFPERFFKSERYYSHEIEFIQKHLDMSLDNHLELWGIWLKSNIHEVIESNSAETLIDVFEVMRDDEFEDTLNRIVSLPDNDKVVKILNHFIEDDEYWVVNLSKRLLSQYNISKK